MGCPCARHGGWTASDSVKDRVSVIHINDSTGGTPQLLVFAISLAEIVYLFEKARIPANALNDLHAAMADPKAVLHI